jgi:hypothetical protein
MNKALLIGLIGLLAPTLFAAESDLQAKVANATKQLGDKPNYSWTTAIREGDTNAVEHPPVLGKTDKSGLIYLRTMTGATATEVYMNGQKGTASGTAGWRTFDEIAKPGGFAAGLVHYVRSWKAPVDEVTALLGKVKDVKEVEGVLSGELKEDAVKELLEFSAPTFQGQEPPKIADPKGSVKFWIQDGMLKKYEIRVQGRVVRGEQESPAIRTTLVEIKSIGTTKLEVPEEAKQKML